MKKEKQILILSLAAVLSISFSACSSTQSKPNPKQIYIADASPLKVTVSSGGRPVTDFEKKLVHRITLTPTDLANLKSGIETVQTRESIDQFGKRYGLELLDSKLHVLGLQRMDTLIAIDETPSPTMEDLQNLLKQLSTTSQASITFEREGRPHKSILAVGKGGA